MRRTLLVPALVILALGCDKGSSSEGGAAPSASSVTATPPPPTQEPAPPPPDELDTTALKKALGCGGKANSGPCRVLTGLDSCSSWNPVVPSGDGRFLGRGYVVEKGNSSEQVTMLRARRVPQNEVGPGQLPVRIGIAELPKDEGLASAQADKTIRGFERKDVPGRGNATIEYLKQREQWSESFATRTAGKQVYVIAQAGTYICEGPSRQIFVVQRAATRDSNSDGMYAELWPASW